MQNFYRIPGVLGTGSGNNSGNFSVWKSYFYLTYLKEKKLLDLTSKCMYNKAQVQSTIQKWTFRDKTAESTNENSEREKKYTGVREIKRKRPKESSHVHEMCDDSSC